MYYCRIKIFHYIGNSCFKKLNTLYFQPAVLVLQVYNCTTVVVVEEKLAAHEAIQAKAATTQDAEVRHSTFLLNLMELKS